MNTKRPLNCYIFSNLIISFLTFNLLTNTTTTNLIKKTSNNVLNRIYEKGNVEYINVEDTLITSNQLVNSKTSNVITISNKVLESSNVREYVKPSYNSLTGSNLVNFALQFVGLPYVSAGNSLTTGTDCSGFTSLIYKEFGVTLGRTVTSQLYSGTYVSKNDLEPGDLIFYSYGSTPTHVALYIGNGQIIHESTPKGGTKISTMNIMNYITARRIITSNVVVSTPIVEQNVNETNTILEESKIEEIIETPKIEEVVIDTSEHKSEEFSSENLNNENKLNENEETKQEVTKTEETKVLEEKVETINNE